MLAAAGDSTRSAGEASRRGALREARRKPANYVALVVVKFQLAVPALVIEPDAVSCVK